MRKNRNILARIATTMVILVGMFFAVSTPAQASAQCYGVVCNGFDPIAEGCSADATLPVNTVVLPDGGATIDLDLRYSPACGAAWARVTIQGTLDGRSVPFVIYNNKGDYSEYTATASGASWSNMVDDATTSVHAYACLGTYLNLSACTIPW